jgi:NAD(P)-dependent dehydrogenase (short-subunit alcohol dehydrogenase family)
MNDSVVLITGASGHLGARTAAAFARAGARLALTGRKAEALESTAQALALPAARVLARTADLRDPSQVQALVEAVVAAWGRLDCLLNLVGEWHGGIALADVTDAQWDGLLDTNLRTAFHTSRAVLPPMLTGGGGRIVHLAARAVEHPGARQVAYNVSKSGLVALTRSIAVDYGSQGIRANAILPGTIDTPDNRSARPGANRSGWVQPDALVAMMLLLCGPAGQAINGAAIPMYGG